MGINIPHSQLSPETLQSLVEDFVTRDGTDYGASEASMAQKTRQVFHLLEQGDVLIVFDPCTETCNIVHKSDIDTT